MAGQEWYGACVITLVVLASGDLGVKAEGHYGPPYQRRRRMADREEHYLEAYDCSEPDEVIAHPVPAQELQDTNWEKKFEVDNTESYNYTIIQKTPTFDYEATLCTVHRTREYYECVWASHVRVKS